MPPRWSQLTTQPVDVTLSEATPPDSGRTAPGPPEAPQARPPAGADGVLMPIYLVLGLGDEHRAAGEELILALRDELATRPTVSDHVRLGIIEFDVDARVRLPLSDPLDPDLRIPSPARRRAGGEGDGEAGDDATDASAAMYGAALDAVYAAIAQDVPALMATSSGVRRPLVWLLVDRSPTDDPARRAASFRDLTGGEGYPFVVASGVGDVPDDELRALLYPVEGDNAAVGYSAPDPAAIGLLLTRTVLAVPGRVERGDRDVVALPGDDGLPAGARRLFPATVP